MAEKQQITINVDPNIYELTNVNIFVSEEQFVFAFFSGNQVRQFLSTPKHTKRIYLLLKGQIENYEKQFGNVEAQNSSPNNTKEKGEEIGFSIKK